MFKIDGKRWSREAYYRVQAELEGLFSNENPLKPPEPEYTEQENAVAFESTIPLPGSEKGFVLHLSGFTPMGEKRVNSVLVMIMFPADMHGSELVQKAIMWLNNRYGFAYYDENIQGHYHTMKWSLVGTAG